MRLLGTYVRGFLPFLIVELISNFNSKEFTIEWTFNWWNVYIIVSYLLIFPIVYKKSKEKKDSQGSVRLDSSLNKASQNPMRLGASYANTNTFGVARIGDSGSGEGRLFQLGILFVFYLLMLIFCPFFLIYYALKK